MLIADDNADNARTLELLLKRLGHQICVVSDGLSALEAEARFRPDIALLDVAMPGLSGHEVARRLRQLRGNAMVLIALTAFGADEDRRASREAGFDHHLVKPIEPGFLDSLLG